MDRLDNLPVETKHKIGQFLENSNLERMSRTIRKLFFAYLRDCKEGLSVDFDEILFDVETLINFLENKN
ncbi:MAG: hypothetical protein KDE33_27220 [Bacteroidetes bacterium]|nr:hypothetical protein [Bacteroidota bacterium]